MSNSDDNLDKNQKEEVNKTIDSEENMKTDVNSEDELLKAQQVAENAVKESLQIISDVINS
ncbi:hypothetical protein [Polaribacter sp. Hel1_85]|uniref:hypothetical protein n=1 Tax=Polaribacter sp. Hel1_85 TaxID=1250005 RepID=UPI00052B74AA|nr:hypothetical protein [Polaribacter sp. Hel1_85]KGL58693.1 hypothetical protein PHEL85_2959 [Polaribacter sp. Hel1_85]